MDPQKNVFATKGIKSDVSSSRVKLESTNEARIAWRNAEEKEPAHPQPEIQESFQVCTFKQIEGSLYRIQPLKRDQCQHELSTKRRAIGVLKKAYTRKSMQRLNRTCCEVYILFAACENGFKILPKTQSPSLSTLFLHEETTLKALWSMLN